MVGHRPKFDTNTYVYVSSLNVLDEQSVATSFIANLRNKNEA